MSFAALLVLCRIEQSRREPHPLLGPREMTIEDCFVLWPVRNNNEVTKRSKRRQITETLTYLIKPDCISTHMRYIQIAKMNVRSV